MSSNEVNMHWVSTHEEASAMIKAHSKFWVSNCGCREPKGGCDQSRMDVCLDFTNSGGSGGGICFCCSCCCSYFINFKDGTCDKGSQIAQTDSTTCTDCGACIDICYFNARKMTDNELTVDLDKCYGCGLCPSLCPPGSIAMVKR